MCAVKSVQEIRQEFARTPVEMYPDLLALYEADGRKGVMSLVSSGRKKYEKYQAELVRLEKMCSYEKQHADAGLICGIDEVGRGPLAGPVVAGAVILPADLRIPYINDSKKLSPARREELSALIREKAVAFSLGMSSAERIDEINILQATYEAMREAVASLSVCPDMLFNDAVTIPGISIPQLPIIGGDGKSMSIAAASIVAKVFRDEMMVEFDRIYPGYGFASNKGYGTADHIKAIKELGPCPIHRKSFIKNIIL